ncbi:hypothetical protein HDU97_006824 [Phlyctochytrium planicorne]|nr:hypothetical protein HDU97_006824 [Phlyctochytrium planicorne]
MTGKVQVRIVSGRSLSRKDLLTSNDAYCEVWLEHDESTKQSTGVVSSNNPLWNETFTFNFADNQKHLTFHVLDKDPKSSQGIGYAQFDFEPLKAKKRTSETKELTLKANLLGLDLTPNGHLTVEVVVL